MCRKQPIPTNLDFIFGDNYLAQDIYIFCLLRARNSDEKIEKEYAKSLHVLEKGQGVFGDSELAKRFRCDRKTIRKTLEKLQNVYNKMDIKRTTRGTVYTIVGYDEVVKMDNKKDNKGTTKGQPRDNTVDTNKNEESDKSGQSENTTSEPKPEIIKSKQDLIELYTVDELTATEQIKAKYTFVYEFADRGYDKIPKSKKGIDEFTNKIAEKCIHAIGKIDRNHLRATLRKIKDREEDNKKKTSNYLSRFNNFLLPKK